GPHIGSLPQNIELLRGSIAENIARFAELDGHKVVEAARQAGVHELILRLPQGYDTRLGEDGGDLSGGQKQRIALARALYGGPSLIVLDEPNSNLDTSGEAALATAIAQMKAQGRTVVLVTHRSAALAQADKLLVLSEGRMQAFGPAHDVMQALSRAQEQAQRQPANAALATGGGA
ncbi:ATP-binding cassette domain-containing protein, partial [Pseudomonas donghuensis]|uniref:ATP-binding cassette domain-containing protein n=1 Tax=Pseudomonas donghuensis TaxID=1163398 RepID=UPI00029B39BC